MVWVNLIAIIILAIALFKQHSDTKKIIFDLKESLQKEISEIRAKADELKTKVSILDPDGIVKRIKEIREEIEQSFSSRMEKLQKLFENYVSKIERRIGLIDKIGQKVSQISRSFEEKLKALIRVKKTEK